MRRAGSAILAAARSLACEFVVPPGARRLAHAPDAGYGSLKPSPPLPGAEEVDRVQYWQVPGSPQGFLTWEKRHLPRALAASGPGACPADGGAMLVLTFRAQPGGPVLAVAEPDLERCEWVSFTIGGKPQPSLGPNDGGKSFAASVVRIAGLPWNLSKMVW